MKTKSAARSFCTGCCLLSVQPAFILLPSDAFVVPSTTHDALVKQHRHQNQHRHHHRPISPLSTAARRCVLVEDGLVGQGLRRPRTRSDIVPVAMSASSGPGESAPGRGAQSVPSGPGAGVIDLKFRELKTGGFKVFLLFFLLGQGRAKDNDTPFSVRDTPEGIRVLIGDENKNDSQWEGVLDLSWGAGPQPFFRVDRIDVNEVIPYPGELYILNKLLDAIIDVNGERSVNDQQKLFLFASGEQGQLAEAKSKLASLASL